jgi:hypothetical protein
MKHLINAPDLIPIVNQEIAFAIGGKDIDPELDVRLY